jgi:uncharacterized protein
MSKLVEEIPIPACEARSFRVDRGQQMRVIAVDGPQAADVVAFNAHEYRESLCVWLTRQQSGSFVWAERFFTKLPSGRVMFTLDEAPPRSFWLSAGRCNLMHYEKRGVQDHPGCQELLAGAIEPHGLSAFEVPDVLNLFMAPTLREDGTYSFEASPVEPGDFVSITAQMDTLVAISACPDDAEYNEGRPKPLRVEIWGA